MPDGNISDGGNTQPPVPIPGAPNEYDYGVISDKPLNNLQLHLAAFHDPPPPERGGMGKLFHFWKIVELLWGIHSKSNKKFFRHPWAERMAELACEHKYLAIHGCGSSGKTDFSAVWSLINWACDPVNTLVLVTSTSLKDSRKRIWGSIIEYYQAAEALVAMGQLVDSIGIIRSISEGGIIHSDRCGISLIPGEKKKEREAIGKIIGMKNRRVFMIADELPELSEALISAAQSNLALNPYFQMIGLGNFNSVYDPLGVFAAPKNGWGSVSVDDDEWETRDGYCLRLDGLKSPNVLSGKDLFPRIYNAKNLAEHRKKYGENSSLFWRMCRSFPSPEGAENCLYSDADFIKGLAHSKATWLDVPIPVIAADPAFTTGGDDFSVCCGLFGKGANGLPTLEITSMATLHEDIALTQQGEARDIQTARQLAAMAARMGVAPKHVGIDASGPGGLAFASIFSMFWGSSFLPIKFQEVGTDMMISLGDPRTGKEAFINLSSEMWWMGKEFVRAGQIKGLTQDVAKQLKSRYYENVKLGEFLKIRMEAKSDMRKRTASSPDQADAFLMLVHLCRLMFGFSPGTISLPGLMVKPTADKQWMERVRKAHSVYENQFA